MLLDLLFPKKCVGCKKTGSYSERQRGASSAYFCKDCISNIKQTDLVCPKCEKLAIGGQTHPICIRRFGLDGLWSLGIYEPPLKQAIQTLKYKGVVDLSKILSEVIVEYWAKYQPFLLDQIKRVRGGGWIIVPVPLHWFRKNDRGFNQSFLLTKHLSESLGLSYIEALKRVRYTKSQVKLKGKERHQNIKNAFEISPNYDKAAMNYVLLIDDVWTTGSTLKECCYILKRAGAKKVWAITLAR